MNILSKQVDASVIAVFDFDNTLTKQDSLIPFLKSISSQSSFWWGMGIKSPMILAYIFKLIPNWQAKEAILTYFLSGKTIEQLNQSAQDFATNTIPTLLHPKALERLRWHQDRGDYTVLLSASPEAYLVPWGEKMGIDRVIGTQLESKSGVLTGHIKGKNCYGQEKVNRLREELGDLDRYCIYAYGDSKGDRELLSLADRAYYRKFDDTTEAESTKSPTQLGKRINPIGDRSSSTLSRRCNLEWCRKILGSFKFITSLAYSCTTDSRFFKLLSSFPSLALVSQPYGIFRTMAK